jgi:hypothetical protein
MDVLNEVTGQFIENANTPLYDKGVTFKEGEKGAILREKKNINPEEWIVGPTEEEKEQYKPIIPVIDKVAQNRNMLIQNEIYIMNYENAEQRLIDKGLIQPKEV